MMPIAPNSTTERTGQGGSIHDAAHDINCPAFGEPEYKLNYYATSCDLRLEAGTCEQGYCPRYKGNQPTGRTANRPITADFKTFVPGSPEKVVAGQECRCCNRVKKIRGRGLCNSCYSHHYYRNTLDKFSKFSTANNVGKRK